MKAALATVLMGLTLVQSTAFAQSRVDAAMGASTQARNAQVITVMSQIDQARTNLAVLQQKLEEAKSKNPGRQTMIWIERAALVGAAASVVAFIHGATHIKGDFIMLPGIGFFAGIGGGGLSAAVFAGAKVGEVALTSNDVKILLGQTTQAQVELDMLKQQLTDLSK